MDDAMAVSMGPKLDTAVAAKLVYAKVVLMVSLMEILSVVEKVQNLACVWVE